MKRLIARAVEKNRPALVQLFIIPILVALGDSNGKPLQADKVQTEYYKVCKRLLKAAFAGQNIQSNPTYVRPTLYSYISPPETGLLRMIMLQYISYLFETEL